ncbi:uncharacterized protein SAPINGB_P003048 [Magnusiomyces paraingens]|uniref:Uncharacterized protein n=1 Tax=Magnusiomyces paraingens TaxID=2606893 RepID=A0A5E8BK70_9ASCO|nr:uncharacterized protein SAPINGB_P003048 [Saprochaete ingens]VVT51292.1 unnamed protein product [Saprochaete ingens]
MFSPFLRPMAPAIASQKFSQSLKKGFSKPIYLLSTSIRTYLTGAGSQFFLRKHTVTNATLFGQGPRPIFKRYNTQLPDRVDPRDPLDNSFKNRLPKFPFHKEAQPTLIPKDSPRVSKSMSFRKLVQTLRSYKEPELLYMAESHRLYLVSCFALAFIVCYNIYDLLERTLPAAWDDYVRNDEDLPPAQNVVKTIGRLGMVLAIVGVYASAAIFFAMIPTRLVRRIYYLPGPREHIQLITHPFLPGRPSPVITLPLEDVTIGKTSKVWTGQGFYGTAQRTQFLFLLFEKGKLTPWIVDRSGWFWGDGRVYDVIFGKEPVEQAELGLSYDDMLKIRQKQVKQATMNLKQELGPAWKLKAMANLMKEDISSASQKLGITNSTPPNKSIRGPAKDKKNQ